MSSWEPGSILWVLSVDIHYGLMRGINTVTFPRECKCCRYQAGETPVTIISIDDIIAKSK